MPKRKKTKTVNQALTELPSQEVGQALELVASEKYQKYVKDHARTLRRLQREAAGWNMVEPEQ